MWPGFGNRSPCLQDLVPDPTVSWLFLSMACILDGQCVLYRVLSAVTVLSEALTTHPAREQEGLTIA